MSKNRLSDPPVTTGPVDNLEYHLRPDWWKHLFNAMYLKTDADVVEDERITAKEVDLVLKNLDLQPQHAILDLACGQGRHLLELGRRQFEHLHGLDRSRYLIQRARSRARQEGLSIHFKEGDVRKLAFASDTFDAVTILGNSFGYFESAEDDLTILKEIFRVLKPYGSLLLDIADGGYLRQHFVPRSWEWIDKKHFVCRERSLASDNERLISREVITHIDKGVIVDQFYAERLYTRALLTGLLEKVGFRDTLFHGHIGADSQRNQDLGMMEKRFLLTTSAVKIWTPKKTRRSLKRVAVVLGDPTLSDDVKPDSRFDHDDLETIEKLKIALSALPDFRFTYYDNHRTMVNDLQKLSGKVDLVFNLCDEGFRNAAAKELHVPALLEVLGLPYTGGGPQTLAFCYDKSLIRGIAAEIGVPVANAFVITAEENLFEFNLSFPVIAKPNFGDSSFGITQRNVANTIEELSEAILRLRDQFGYGKPILVEEFLTGAEVSVGIIGNPPAQYTVLPIVEEDYSNLPEGLPPLCGYEAKWLPDSPYMQNLRSVPANLPGVTEQAILDACLRLFERLDCRDYCRFDWRLNAGGEPKLLEVNPNPGWCWDGHLAKMATLAGMSYSGMLEAILRAAENRYAHR